MVDLELIKQRKSLYGDNMKSIADKWSSYLEFELHEKDICEMMALMKEVRIEETQKKINELKSSLEDSESDKDNYRWIARNFKEYKKL